jgi:hypothetical protein
VSAQKFKSKVCKLGINPVVDPPDDVLQAIFEQAGRSKGPIPVHGLINGAAFIQTLVKYQGAWRLYINGEMLKASGLKVGDAARIEVEADPRPREVAMPNLFLEVLSNNAEAKLRFEALTPSRKRGILLYLNSLRTERSLTKNIEKVITQLGDKPI